MKQADDHWKNGMKLSYKNAESLIKSAKTLCSKKGSYGHAFAMATLAIEEASKAFLCSLAALGLISPVTVKKSMKRHPEKRALRLAIKNKELAIGKDMFGNLYDNRKQMFDNGTTKIAIAKITKEHDKAIKQELDRRNLCLYVDESNGNWTTPHGIKEDETKKAIKSAETYIKVCKYLSDFNLEKLSDPKYSHLVITPSYDERLNSFTIMYDEA
ncbi:hypothetical protein ES706_04497 [subsurface metagenome]